MQLNSSLTKKIITYSVLFLLLIFALFLVRTFVFRTVLEIEINQSNTNQKIEVAIREINTNSDIAKKSTTSGKLQFRLPPGSYAINAQGNGVETLGFSKLKRFNKSKLSLELHKEKSAQKIGSGSLGCDVLIQNQLYSYACTSPSSIVRLNNPLDKFIFPTPLNSGVRQQAMPRNYLGGVLARFDQHQALYLDYIDLASDQRTRIEVPEGSPEDYSIVIDKTDITNSRFVLVDTYRRLLYIYKNTQTKPTRIEVPNSDETPVVSYSLSGNKLTLFAGLADYASDTEEEAVSQKKIERGYLYTLDIDQPSMHFDKLSLKHGFTANEVTRVGKNIYIVQKMNSLEIYQQDNTDLNLIYFIQGPNSISINKNGDIFFTRNNGVYYYSRQSNQANRVFTSPRVQVSRTGFGHNGQAIFNGFIEGDGQRLHSFVVTPDDQNERRWEEFLPYSRSSGLPIIQMDYVGGAIKTQLSLRSIISDRQTGTTSYDPTEFETAKQAVLNRLRADGIDLSKTKVYFTN